MYLDHVNIKAAAGLLEKVRDFYCAVLGLETGPRPAFRERGYWLYSGDQAIIHLSECIGVRERVPNAAFDHFALRVQDLSAIIEQLQRAGVEFQQSLVPGTGMQQVFFRDPAGTKVEIQCAADKP